MGAEGCITIWDADKVQEKFPNCKELFLCLPTAYRDSLKGKDYYHCYGDSNSYSSWWCEDDWCLDSHPDIRYNKNGNIDKRTKSKVVKELKTFVEWLQNNIEAYWEVWT